MKIATHIVAALFGGHLRMKARRLVFGIVLTRPLKRLERAIAGLGENRLDDRIEIPGPSDLRSIGQRLDQGLQIAAGPGVAAIAVA